MATRVTRKGQVTIPSAVRRLAGIGTGDAVEFRIDERGQVVLERADRLARLDAALARLADEPPIRTITTDQVLRMTRGDGR